VSSAATPAVLQVSRDAPADEALLRSAAWLRQGGLLIFPTDTLYALGCLARDVDAVAALLALKRRAPGRPLPLVASDRTQVGDLVAHVSGDADRLMTHFWPGPLTLVLPARSDLPAAIGGGTGTVGVRVPAAVLVRRLCALTGPLVATSANVSGAPPPVSCAEALAGLAGIALALDGGAAASTLPSTIVDMTSAPRLLRAGSVAWEEIHRVLAAEGC
jgi:L-threonylcarbamoyladenylate synthase